MAHLYKRGGGLREELGPSASPRRKPIHLCCPLGRLKPKPMSGTARAEHAAPAHIQGVGVARGTDLFQQGDKGQGDLVPAVGSIFVNS